MSELRDVEAIRNGIAREVYARSPRRPNAYRCADDIIAKFVEPLLSALAAEKARVVAMQRLNEQFAAGSAATDRQLLRAVQQLRQVRAQVADRDAKLAAAQKFRDGVQALFDGEVAARTECAGRAARGEDCGCSTKDCYEHGNWHNCTCSPLDAMVPLAMEYDAALSLPVPTSPQTRSTGRPSWRASLYSFGDSHDQQ